MRSQAEPCEMNISDKDVDEKVNAVNRFPLHNCLGRFLLLKRPHSRIDFFIFTVQYRHCSCLLSFKSQLRDVDNSNMIKFCIITQSCSSPLTSRL